MLIAIPKFNNPYKISIYLSILLLYLIGFSPESYSQQTNNSSSLTNSAAPSASSVTTGGTNINYQSNFLVDNDYGKMLFSNENDIEYYINNLKKNISKIDNNMILYDIKSKNIYLITDENVYSRINI